MTCGQYGEADQDPISMETKVLRVTRARTMMTTIGTGLQFRKSHSLAFSPF